MRSNEGVGLMRWIDANNGVYGRTTPAVFTCQEDSQVGAGR